MSMLDFLIDGIARLFGADTNQGEMPAGGYHDAPGEGYIDPAAANYAQTVHKALDSGRPERTDVGRNGHRTETLDQLATRTHEESIKHLRSVGVKVSEDKEPSLYERQLHPGKICTPVRGRDGKFELLWTDPEE